MCGISGIVGGPVDARALKAMARIQRHRGPDALGLYLDPARTAGLAHNRLSVIDLSASGNQPLPDPSGRYWIAYNGEVYNYLELRSQLSGFPFRSDTDTEVVLAAWLRWGEAALDRFIGMFAFVIWDQVEQSLFAARDRFGVKPLYYVTTPSGQLLVSSEIKALHAAGWSREPDEVAWATYLGLGVHDHSERTFWRGVKSLPPGHSLTWRRGKTYKRCWYDLARADAPIDTRPEREVQDEYFSLLADSVRLRFRSDVPVGINLSGGLDSSLLLGVVDATQGADCDVEVFTFVTGDARYDELPWVVQMLEGTRHPLRVCELSAADVPDLAESVLRHQDEPFGGVPTLAYARLFEQARRCGVVVLLDGQGLDEQWAGYDYYRGDLRTAGTVQGTREPPVRTSCLHPDFLQLGERFSTPTVFGDPLRDLQYRDIRHTKIPRALRFNDRVSMRTSTELREPFLDHRLVELAHRQPATSKIRGTTGKWMLRQLAADLLPGRIVEAPKRPLQTPQREWLRDPLRDWATDQIEGAIRSAPWWLVGPRVREEWDRFVKGSSDNSYYVWQWVSLGLLSGSDGRPWATNDSKSGEPVCTQAVEDREGLIC